MPQLLLLRHAKSSWASPTTGDHDRPLTTRGVRAAAQLGIYLDDHALTPDLILTSSATRARQTVAGVVEGLATPREVQVEVQVIDALYNASLPRLLEIIARQGAGATMLLVVGHNPSIAQAALHFAAGQGGAALTRLSQKYPTAALAQFDTGTANPGEFDISAMRLVSFTTPADREKQE
ncbi:MAG: histidine phosphatase family protein [Hyphomicrobiales bacterium]